MSEPTKPAPDPGNAPPEEWSEDLDLEAMTVPAESINAVAMSLPPLPEGEE